MTLTARDVAYSVFGAFRLARFDAKGLDYIDRTPEGALRSFYAAVIVLPAYVLILLLRNWERISGAPLLTALTVEGIAYVVSWTAYPVVMHTVASMLDRTARYPGFVAAYNWSSVVQMAVYVPVLVLAETGLLPEPFGDALVFGVMMAMLTYQWFVLRTALDVNGFMAASLVLLDLLVSAMISDVSDGML